MNLNSIARPLLLCGLLLSLNVYNTFAQVPHPSSVPTPRATPRSDPSKPFTQRRVPFVRQELLVTLKPVSLPLRSSERTLIDDLVKGLRALGVEETGVKRIFPSPTQKISIDNFSSFIAPTVDIVSTLKTKFVARAKRAEVGALQQLSNVFLLHFKAGAKTDAARKALMLHPLVKAVQRNFIYESTQSSSPSPAPTPDVWGTRDVGAPEAWGKTQGRGTLVAIVDTGIDRGHPDLINNIWTNAQEIPGNCIDDDHNGLIDDTWGWNFAESLDGWDFYGDDCASNVEYFSPMDRMGHGTHVSGTVAGHGHSSPASSTAPPGGVVGVAPKARLMAVKGLDDNGMGTTEGLAQAMVYAMTQGADVINCSWGGGGMSPDPLIEQTLNLAAQTGVVIVKAVGNSNNFTESVGELHSTKQIRVAAYGRKGEVSDFSNKGSDVDVGAPGEDILSAQPCSVEGSCDSSEAYASWNGTSMATPHVAGTVALMLSVNPSLTPDQVRQVIRVTAKDASLPGFDFDSGAGHVSANAAVVRAIQIRDRIKKPPLGVVITAPKTEDRELLVQLNPSKDIEIVGDVYGQGVRNYTLSYRPMFNDDGWHTISTGTAPRLQAKLGSLRRGTLPTNRYLLRLQATDQEGQKYEDYRMMLIDRDREVRTAIVQNSTPDNWDSLSIYTLAPIARGVSYSISSPRLLVCDADREDCFREDSSYFSSTLSYDTGEAVHTPLGKQTASYLTERESSESRWGVQREMFSLKKGAVFFLSKKDSSFFSPLYAEHDKNEYQISSNEFDETPLFSQSQSIAVSNGVVVVAAVHESRSNSPQTLMVFDGATEYPLVERSSNVCYRAPSFNATGDIFSVVRFNCGGTRRVLELLQYSVNSQGQFGVGRVVKTLATTPSLAPLFSKADAIVAANDRYIWFSFSNGLVSWNGQIKDGPESGDTAFGSKYIISKEHLRYSMGTVGFLQPIIRLNDLSNNSSKIIDSTYNSNYLIPPRASEALGVWGAQLGDEWAEEISMYKFPAASQTSPTPTPPL
jgi:subtilisin family serine protease